MDFELGWISFGTRYLSLVFLLFAFQNQWQLGIQLLGEGKWLLWVTTPIICSCVIMLVNLKGPAETPVNTAKLGIGSGDRAMNLAATFRIIFYFA